METKKLEKRTNSSGLVLYLAAVLALAALIATAWAARKEGGVWVFLALAVWLPAFCVDLCETGRRRLRDLATSFLFSAALFPVVLGERF